jgi:hypothetical protein
MSLRLDERIGSLAAALTEQKAEAPPPAERLRDQPVVFAGLALILLSWALLFQIKTGDIQLVLTVLVATNLAGWATVMLLRRRSAR